MFGFLKPLFQSKVAIGLVILAVLARIYQVEVANLLKIGVARYLDKTNKNDVEMVTVKFTDTSGTIFTPEQLATYNGENEAPIYLALLGGVFDVSRGKKHYGTGCSYNFFVGRDASVSFVTGNFDSYDSETSDDVLSLKSNNLIELDRWYKFYEKEYTYKGKLIGRFYDEHGLSTTYHKKFNALLEQAQIAQAQFDELSNKYPGCNIEWSEERGTRVWCTPTSGDGKLREWSGYPRKLYIRDNKNFNCACIPEEELNDSTFKPYDNCEPRALECFYRV